MFLFHTTVLVNHTPVESLNLVTDTNGFSGVDGTSNFTGSIVNVTPTQTMCVYVVLDVLSTANDTDTIEIEVTNPSIDVTVLAKLFYPATSIEIASTTISLVQI